MPGTAVPAVQSGCLQECMLDVLMESLPGGALALAVSAMGTGLCPRKREESRSLEQAGSLTAVGLVAPRYFKQRLFKPSSELNLQ